MSGPGADPALVTGALDDGGGNDYLKKYLEDLRKSLDIVEESGVKIRNNFTDSAIDHANIGEFTIILKQMKFQK